jgi:PKD repeat protein
MNSLIARGRTAGIACLTALAVLAAGAAASAETLLMPNRDMLASTSEVVWGVSTLANGTAYTLSYGDGTPNTVGVLANNQSYLAFNHTYASQGPYTVTLTVGAEVATTQVTVFNAAVLSAFDLRGVNINRAIQNGLRYLYTTQTNRQANFVAGGRTTDWSSTKTATSFVVLAFENHGYLLANDGSAPTGVYQKYVVERGLNYVASQLSQLNLTVQAAGSPCVGAGVEAAPCVGLYDTFDAGYSTAVAALSFAGSTALNRVFPAGLGGTSGVYITGKTYREVLQRIVNSSAFGQSEGPGIGRGGWDYGFNSPSRLDGSTVGWDVLAFLDSAAAGITVPAFVQSEFLNFGLPAAANSDGSFDYQADGNPINGAGGVGYASFSKGGIGLQGRYWVGQVGVGDANVATGVNYLSARWAGGAFGGDYTGWGCGSPSSNNKGCVYGMFNTFKALKLHAVTTLPGVGLAPLWPTTGTPTTRTTSSATRRAQRPRLAGTGRTTASRAAAAIRT